MKTVSLIISMISIMLIYGCASHQEQAESTSLDIPHESKYTVLYIQGVGEDGISSEETSKYITENKKLKSFIDAISKLEVVKPSEKEISEKVKELNEPGNYMFVLSDAKTMDHHVYHINVFKDGSIQFQGKDEQEIMYESKEKHPDLNQELKSTLNINF